MSQGQRNDVVQIYENTKGAGVLDFVAAWYLLAAKYLVKNKTSKAAFVSTNSVTQGEQVGIIWRKILKELGLEIQFAHQTFKWQNEAKGVAAVYCIIVGYSLPNGNAKRLFTYSDIKAEPTEIKVNHINSYLVAGTDVFIQSRQKPICNVPEITYGSMANDGGHLLLTEEEYSNLIHNYPNAIKIIRPFLGSNEFINKIPRFCIWLNNLNSEIYKDIKPIIDRINLVKHYRLQSKRKTTVALASIPSLFAEIRQPQNSYILIPGVSSENRLFIPIGFLTKDIIASDLTRTIPNANIYHFGTLTSLMHMTWVRYVCGRLKSDYRYSNSIVYNNFPWPENPTLAKKQAVEEAAQAVLDTRAKYPDSSLATLYNSLTMPPDLLKAHQALDKAVDKCYRKEPFTDERERIEYLFGLYEKYTSGLLASEVKKKGRK